MSALTPEALKEIVKEAIREECAGRITIRIPKELVERSAIIFAGLFAMSFVVFAFYLVSKLGGTPS